MPSRLKELTCEFEHPELFPGFSCIWDGVKNSARKPIENVWKELRSPIVPHPREVTIKLFEEKTLLETLSGVYYEIPTIRSVLKRANILNSFSAGGNAPIGWWEGIAESIDNGSVVDGARKLIRSAL